MGQNACREEQGEIMFFRKKEKKNIYEIKKTETDF